jgi:hypothetical protein
MSVSIAKCTKKDGIKFNNYIVKLDGERVGVIGRLRVGGGFVYISQHVSTEAFDGKLFSDIQAGRKFFLDYIDYLEN